MIRRRYFVLLLSLSPYVLFGQGSSTSASQLKLPLNARSAALGDATVSDAGQLSSWLLNPANLYTSGGLSVSLTHSQWIQDVQSEFIGVQIPLSVGTVGLALSTSSVPGIEIRDAPGPSLGTFSARFASMQLGVAGDLFESVTAGVTGKYLYEKLYTDDAVGFGFDAGLLYHTPVKGLQAGLSITNAGSLNQFRHERSDLPTFARAGVTYLFALDEFDFSASAAFANNLQYSETHAEGSLEAVYNNLLSVRLGYASGYESRGLTAGLGVHYEFLQFDYGYVPFSLGLGNGHLFSIGFQF